MSEMLTGLKCILIEFINDLMKYTFGWLIDVIAWLVLLLPNSPMRFEPIEWGDWGNFVGYFIPVATMIQHMGLILTAVAVWYSIQYALRLVKAIQ